MPWISVGIPSSHNVAHAVDATMLQRTLVKSFELRVYA